MIKEELKFVPRGTPVIIRMFGKFHHNYFPAIFQEDNGDGTYTVLVDENNWPSRDLGKFHPSLTVYADQIYPKIQHMFCKIPMKDSEVQMRTFRLQSDAETVTKIEMKDPKTGEFEHIPRVQSFAIRCSGPQKLPTIDLELVDF
jgi:hypothetical protein